MLLRIQSFHSIPTWNKAKRHTGKSGYYIGNTSRSPEVRKLRFAFEDERITGKIRVSNNGIDLEEHDLRLPEQTAKFFEELGKLSKEGQEILDKLGIQLAEDNALLEIVFPEGSSVHGSVLANFLEVLPKQCLNGSNVAGAKLNGEGLII